jgi:hypothetical protein
MNNIETIRKKNNTFMGTHSSYFVKFKQVAVFRTLTPSMKKTMIDFDFPLSKRTND